MWQFYVWIYYIFFIQSSVDGHLGCFYPLTIVNNTAVNMSLQTCVWVLFSTLLDIHPEMELLDHINFFFFLRTSILFSTSAVPLYIPTNSAQELQFLCTLFSSSIGTILNTSGDCPTYKYCVLILSSHWFIVSLSPPTRMSTPRDRFLAYLVHHWIPSTKN